MSYTGQPAVGTITQITNINTAVTLNAQEGVITTVSTSLTLAGGPENFTLNNTYIAGVNTKILCSLDYGGVLATAGMPFATIKATGAGAATVSLCNPTAVATNAVINITFKILQ